MIRKGNLKLSIYFVNHANAVRLTSSEVYKNAYLTSIMCHFLFDEEFEQSALQEPYRPHVHVY